MQPIHDSRRLRLEGPGLDNPILRPFNVTPPRAGAGEPEAPSGRSFPPGTMRPYYFNVVVWGETYRRYLVDYCLPSLLAPGNIPALRDLRGSRLLVATTRDDWDALRSEPTFERVASYVEPELLEIPPRPPDVPNCVHMGLGHRLITMRAAQDKARGVFLTPDLLVSDGTLATAEARAEAGAAAVLIAAYRFRDDPLLRLVQEGGIRPAEPLALSGRRLAEIGLASLHSETQCYEWASPFFSPFPVACYWRVRKGDGILLHAFSWAMLLFDYGWVGTHDTRTLDDGWTIDGDYLHRNLSDLDRIALITDSDDGMLVSWAPEPRKKPYKVRDLFKNIGLFGDVLRGETLQKTFHDKAYDPMKRALFFVPVRWHAGDLGPAWRSAERRALDLLRSCLTLSREQVEAADRVRSKHGLPALEAATGTSWGMPQGASLDLLDRAWVRLWRMLWWFSEALRRRTEYARLAYELSERWFIVIPLRVVVPRMIGRRRWENFKGKLLRLRYGMDARS